MEKVNLMKDISERTGGDIYLGVVGPVRTGKSTFIKRFMELMVLPNILDYHDRERALDELPQSAGGRTVMTSEPKFVPAEAVSITLESGLEMSVRLVDCVGYAVPGALGFDEEDGPRLVHTPWQEEPMPFEQAAEIGTRKVICDHSAIGLVVTCDGSITDLPRDAYLEAEQRVISELQELGKPFVIVLNSTDPYDEATLELAEQLKEQYQAAVLPVDVMQLTEEEIFTVLEAALYEFPVTEVNVVLPRWIEELAENHCLRCSFEDLIKDAVTAVQKICDMPKMLSKLEECEYVEKAELNELVLGTGAAQVCVSAEAGLFYRVLAEMAGREIEGDHSIMAIVRDFAKADREWRNLEVAMNDARSCGYGVVTPSTGEMYLEEPDLVKQGGRFGVKLRASAPSFHIIRASIATEITPLFGTEKQCEELVRYILSEFESDPQKIWETNIFGKSLQDLVQEGIEGKIYRMPDNAQHKLQETLQRIINEGGGGLICIVL